MTNNDLQVGTAWRVMLKLLQVQERSWIRSKSGCLATNHYSALLPRCCYYDLLLSFTHKQRGIIWAWGTPLHLVLGVVVHLARHAEQVDTSFIEVALRSGINWVVCEDTINSLLFMEYHFSWIISDYEIQNSTNICYHKCMYVLYQEIHAFPYPGKYILFCKIENWYPRYFY